MNYNAKEIGFMLFMLSLSVMLPSFGLLFIEFFAVALGDELTVTGILYLANFMTFVIGVIWTYTLFVVGKTGWLKK